MRNSNIEYFIKCPRKYDFSVNKNIKMIPDPAFDNALILGSTLHLGAETGDLEKAINFYYSNYAIISDKHENEVIKLEYFIVKLIDLINELGEQVVHEIPFKFGSFHGTADLLVKNDDGSWDLYDYKYSNNIELYCETRQLHIYKYFLEKMGYKIKRMAFIFIPKTRIRQKKSETIEIFRTRLKNTLLSMQIKIKYLEYDYNKVIDALIDGMSALECKEYNPNITRLCDYCEYKKLCLEGDDLEVLPSIERKESVKVKYKKNWYFGAPFSGKTTLADKYPTPLLLATDTNYQHFTMPYIHIKDKITVNGRIINKTFAWELFKDVISELEKGEHGFETVIIDLLEDTKEMARVFMYDKLSIEHESDNSFKAWDMIRNEWLGVIKRIISLSMNVVLLSHEDQSKDITKKTGDKITRIAPNLGEKESLKVAGMVDFVGRIINEDGERYIIFKNSPVEFGGGRLNIADGKKYPLNYESIEQIYLIHNGDKEENNSDENLNNEEIEKIENNGSGEVTEIKTKRLRKKKGDV